MFYRSILCFSSVLIAVAIGCGPAKPGNFPKLVSCTVKVVDGAAPVDQVAVLLTPTGSCAFSTSGATNISGTAVIYTAQGTYVQKGASPGEYTVSLTKPPLLTDVKSPEEIDQMSMIEQEKYYQELAAKQAKLPRIIPDKLTDPATSPLTLTVSDSGGELTVDLTRWK